MFKKMRQATEDAIRIIAIILVIVFGITTPSWSDDLTGTFNADASVTWTVGTTHYPDSNPAIGFDLIAGGTAQFNYDIPTFNVVAPQVDISSDTTAFAINPSLQFATAPTLNVTQNINYSTNVFLDYVNQVTLCVPFTDLCATTGPDIHASASVPNLSYDGVTLTTQGNSVLSGTSGVSSDPLNVTAQATTDSLWSLSGDQIYFLSEANIPYVSAAATVISAAGFYLNSTVGLGIDADYSLDVMPSLNTLVDVSDNSLGIHTYSITVPLTLDLQFAADYDYAGTTSLHLGNSYPIIGFDTELLSVDLGSFDVGSGAWDQYINYGDVTITGTYNVIGTPTSVPEPATLSLFGLGLIGLAGLRRKFNRV